MNKPRLVEKKYLLPFVLLTTLFALWGFANDITNPMVAAFQTVMELKASEASLVQFAFYGGYATMAVPAALFIRRYSYKSGIMLGLALYALGAASRSMCLPSDWRFWRLRPIPLCSRWAARRRRHAV